MCTVLSKESGEICKELVIPVKNSPLLAGELTPVRFDPSPSKEVAVTTPVTLRPSPENVDAVDTVTLKELSPEIQRLAPCPIIN